MHNNFWSEISVLAIFGGLLLLVLNPFGFWMPNALVMMLTLGLAIAFAVFAGFVWRENARDEREALHRMLAGRVAFLVGGGILVIGIGVQAFRHELDVWLVLALGAMLLAKVLGLAYGRVKR